MDESQLCGDKHSMLGAVSSQVTRPSVTSHGLMAQKCKKSEHMSLTQSQLGGNHAEGSFNHSTQTTQITKRFTSRSRSQEGDLRAPAGRCACVKALIYIYK